MIYLDSSALVKRYIEEPGSDKMRSLLEEDQVFATSRLTYPEILSAFTRKHRTGELSRAKYNGLLRDFESAWGIFLIIEFGKVLMPAIKKIIAQHGLKGADGIHLASATWLRSASKDEIVFVTSDQALLEAARKEGLNILDPI